MVTKVVVFAAPDPYLAEIAELVSFLSMVLLGGQHIAYGCLSPVFAMAKYSRFGKYQTPEAGVVSNDIWEVSVSMWMAPCIISIHCPSSSNSNSSAGEPPTLLRTKAW